MPDGKESANELESLNSKPGDGVPPAEGQKPLKTPEQLLSEHKAENQRKSEEVSKLKAEKTKLEAELAELREKKKEDGLSKKEEEREEDLQEQVKLAAKALRREKETLPWIEIAREEIGDAMVNAEIQRANWYVEDTAEEMGIESDELAKKLTPFALKYNHLPAERRNRLAVRDLKRDEAKSKDIQTREERLKELEEKEKSFREGRGTIPRQSQKDDKFNDADKRDRLKMAVDLIG